jgi:DNA-binding NarL/FixJ family response regulator
MIRVLIVDDHEVLRAGLRSRLERESGIAVAGEADTAERAVVIARALQPDLILLDLLLPRKSGYDVIPELAAVAPELGARLVNPTGSPALEPLSERERDILHLLALGYTNQEIGKKLYISVRTVDTHRAHIMRKLQLETRAELVMFALANGVIGPSAG